MRDTTITYDSTRRMMYHPAYHFAHRVKMNEEELQYLCYYYERDSLRSLSFALGRTEVALKNLYHRLKKNGKAEQYKNAYLKQFE